MGPFYWLDPNKKETGDYFVHQYFLDHYDEKLPIAEHFNQTAYKKRLFSNFPCSLKEDFQKEAMGYPFQRTRYIGNLDPELKGVTAFFAKHLTHEELMQSSQGKKKFKSENAMPHSLLEAIEHNEDYDVLEWFGRYFRTQEKVFISENNKKSPNQGRIANNQVSYNLILSHFNKEREHFKASKLYIPDQLLTHAKDYLNWVAKKSEGVFKTFKCSFTEERLSKIYDNLIKGGRLKNEDIERRDFISAFSNEYRLQKIRYIGMKSVLGAIISLILKEKPVPEDVKKVFQFAKGKPFDSNDTREPYKDEKDAVGI